MGEVKTVKVDKKTWKRLMQMKLDRLKASMNELLEELLEEAGY